MEGTPEIVRRRRENSRINASFARSLGLGSLRTPPGGDEGSDTESGKGRAEASENGLTSALKPHDRSKGGQECYRGTGETEPLEDLIERWPGRKEQIRELACIFGEPGDGVPVPPLYISGPSSCGKTGVVRALLQSRGFRHVYINCHEVTSRSSLFRAVVQGLAVSREEILEANRVERSFNSEQHPHQTRETKPAEGTNPSQAQGNPEEDLAGVQTAELDGGKTIQGGDGVQGNSGGRGQARGRAGGRANPTPNHNPGTQDGRKGVRPKLNPKM
ncbi:unnamed protein product [Discosporangium mesarthrocarpum]